MASDRTLSTQRSRNAIDLSDGQTPAARGSYRLTEYLVNAPPAWLIEFGPSAA